MLARAVATKKSPTTKTAHASPSRPPSNFSPAYERKSDAAAPKHSWSFANISLHPADRRSQAGLKSPRLQLQLPIQAKLEVGAVNDPLEREADRVAGEVLRMPKPAAEGKNHGTAQQNFSGNPAGSPTMLDHGALLQRQCSCGGSCDKCKAHQPDEEQGKLQRKPQISRVASSSAAPGMEAPSIVHEVLRSPGRPLDADKRAFFEPRFGCNFSGVRLHADARAGESARAVGALAYTVGNHIVFQTRELSQSGSEAKALMAHELAHVVQQEGNSSQRPANSVRTHAPGSEAHANADSFSEGRTSRLALQRRPGGAVPEMLQRQPANQPAKQPDEPLDAALARQDLFDRIGKAARKLDEQLDAAQVERVQEAVRVAPFFVGQDPVIQRTQKQIADVPARLAKLQSSLKVTAKSSIAQADSLDQLQAKIALFKTLNDIFPLLLHDTTKYEALLKQKKTGESHYADTVAFFERTRREIEATKRLLPASAAYLEERSGYLEKQATFAAKKAGVDADTPASIDQLDLLRTMIEASPTLMPYLTQKRGQGGQRANPINPRNFVIESNKRDFEAAKQRAGIAPAEPGKEIGGFYDRHTDTIHVPPDALLGAALHEAVHRYSELWLKDQCSHWLNEGLTQYFTDKVLADQGLPVFTGHAYQKELECAKRFIGIYHLEQVAPAYFLGQTGSGTGSLHQFLASARCHTFCAPEGEVQTVIVVPGGRGR